jgi:hypothetical protein
MCSTDIAVLFWLSQRKQWPPQFPRRGTLLTPYDDPQTPREEWGATEWRAYALFLEESGARIMRDLTRFENDLQETRRKLSRRKAKPNLGQHPGTSLLGRGLLDDYPKGKKRGRKPSGKRVAIAIEVLAIRTELEANGRRRVTDRAALEEFLARKGKRRSRASEHRTILNAVSEYRKSQNF